MFRWLRRIDEALFSPPHRFEEVLALVAPSLNVSLDMTQAGDQQRTSEQQATDQSASAHSHATTVTNESSEDDSPT